MGKYLSTFDTLADYEAATSELGYPNVSLIKADGSIIYVKNAPTPTHSICYEIIPETIGSYTATTYDSVYSVTDAKWYMLNNLNQYEEYGVYDIVEDISSATTYEGKLGVVGTTEYQYSGGSWSVVGTYEDSTVTYEIDDTDPSPYVGQELSTTFKIPVSDVEALGGHLDFTIKTQDGGRLTISTTRYRYMGNETKNGTVTSDATYYYYELPDIETVTIQRIQYRDSTPIHLIVGSKQASVEYVEKATPSYSIYSTVEEMEAVSCPNVGINEYAFVGNDLYKYFANEEWSEVEYTNPKMIALYENEDPLIVYNNNNGELTQGEAQANGTSFITVYIGNSVTSIGNNAFQNCSSLTSVTIPDSVTSIGNKAFSSCRGLTSIDIPSGVTSIGNNAFFNCSGLTSVNIPDSVTSIGDSAFSDCRSLTSINIPSGVTSIGYGTFAGCTSLTSIDIPSGVTSIGEYAFGNIPWWNTYSADTSHRYGNIIYINDVAYRATSSGITSCTFKEGTLGIGGGAFTNCSGLTSVTIPDSVTSIGDNAFSGCKSLRNIEIPSGVTSIGGTAFYGCSGLASIEIPSGVTSIGRSAFYGCSGLTSIDIPSGVTSIGNNAFFNCSGLTSVTVNATTPPTLGGYAFDETNNCPIYVPSASVDAYKAASGWSTYADRIQAIP